MMGTRWLVAVAVVLLAVTNLWWIARQEVSATAAWDHKIQRAERILYYRATPDEGPRFELRGDERTISLISHAVFRAELYDPRRVTRYAVALRLLDADGQERWRDEIHLRTRQSKQGHEGRFWRDENAFVRAQSVQITDDRLTRVELPDEIGLGWQLAIRGAGAVDEVLVRAYVDRERSPTETARRTLAMDPLERRERARRTGLGDWGHFSPAERHAMASRRWDRMAAIGENGTDYQTRVVYYSGFRVPLETASLERSLAVEPGFPIVTNVLGPTAIRVRATTETPGARVRVEAVSTADPPSPRVPAIPREGLDEVFFVREGVHSLRWFAEGGPIALQIEALAGGDAQFGKYARERFLSGDLRPDWRRVPAAISGPGRAAVRLPVPSGSSAATRRLRVSLRALTTLDDPLPSETTAVIVTRNAEGDELAREVRGLEVAAAPFDRFETDAGPMQVGVRNAFDLVPSPDAAVVEISAGEAIAVQGYHHYPDDEPELLDRPYRDVPVEGVRWRAAPQEREHWFLVRPMDWNALAERGDTGRLVLQVRLDAVEDAADDGSRRRVARALKPVGAPQQRLVVDPVPRERRRATLREWPPGSRARLRLGRATMVDLDAGAGRPAVEYWAPVAALGTSATVHVGAQRRQHTITATRGRFRLEGSGSVPVTLEVADAAGRGFEAMINRPPRRGGDAGLVRFKTVYRLTRRGLRLRVRTDGTRKTINAIVYHSSRDDAEDVQIVATVDGGEPRRHARGFSRFTPDVRAYPLGPPRSTTAPAFVDVRGRRAGYPRLVAITLGDDLEPGVHTVRVSIEGGGGWARFFVMGSERGGRSEGTTSFRRREEDPP